MSADVVAACRQEIEPERDASQYAIDHGQRATAAFAALNLAKLDAFTAILDHHEATNYGNDEDGQDWRCTTCTDEYDDHAASPCPTVRIIAERLGVPVDGQDFTPGICPRRDDVPLRWAVPPNGERDEELREELAQVREAERSQQ